MKIKSNSMQLFKYNRSSIIAFEIIYKLVSTTLMVPILYSLINYSVKVAGIRYLMSNTVKKYFMTPTTYLLFVVFLMIAAIIVLIDITALIYAMEASHREQKTNPVTMFIRGVSSAVRIINPKNYKVIPYVIFILPFTYTTMISGTLLVNKIPEFLRIYIHKNKLVIAVGLVLYMILCIYTVYRIFALNYFTIYKISFNKAIKISKQVVGNRVWKVAIILFLYNAFFTVMFLLLGGTLATLIAKVTKTFISYKKARFALDACFRIIFLILYIILAVISTPIIYSYICSKFYEMDVDEAHKEFEEVVERRHKHLTAAQVNRRNIVATTILLVLSLLADGIYVYMSLKGKVDLHILYPTRASVTAHRGDSHNAPENTMPAFMLAVENKADIIEIDVRQTADGEYVVIHDKSLERTTGDKHNVGDVNLEYIRSLDAGGWFSDEYKGVKIPLFEEVLEFASENDVKLNIELKSAKTDKDDYLEGIIALIEQYDMVNKSMLASSKYEELKAAKLINEDISTLYILHFAYNLIGDMKYVDAFSIRYNYINRDLVRDIHKHGKKVYCWTIDTEKKIKTVLLDDVDGIITNNPYNTKNIVYNANSGIVEDLLNRICEYGW